MSDFRTAVQPRKPLSYGDPDILKIFFEPPKATLHQRWSPEGQDRRGVSRVEKANDLAMPHSACSALFREFPDQQSTGPGLPCGTERMSGAARGVLGQRGQLRWGRGRV